MRVLILNLVRGKKSCNLLTKIYWNTTINQNIVSNFQGMTSEVSMRYLLPHFEKSFNYYFFMYCVHKLSPSFSPSHSLSLFVLFSTYLLTSSIFLVFMLSLYTLSLSLCFYFVYTNVFQPFLVQGTLQVWKKFCGIHAELKIIICGTLRSKTLIKRQ